MKVPHDEGVATHIDSESCAVAGDCGGEALTGGHVGQVLSHEMNAPTRKSRVLRDADAVVMIGRQHRLGRYCEAQQGSAWSKTLCMHARTSCGNREVPWPSAERGIADRIRNPQGAS
jgi:hypothetical protein